MDYNTIFKVDEKIINSVKPFICKNIYEKKICNGTILPKHHCSRFVIQSSMRLFNWKKEYSFYSQDAWNLKYKEDVYEVLWSEKDNLPLNYNNLFNGIIMGIYYPFSKYNDSLDIKNNKIEYTHLALFIKETDFDYNNTRAVLHYFKDFTEYISFNDMFGYGIRKEDGFVLKELLVNKENFTKEQLNFLKAKLIEK